MYGVLAYVTFAVTAFASTIGFAPGISPFHLFSPPGVWLPLILAPPVFALYYFHCFAAGWLLLLAYLVWCCVWSLRRKP